MQLLNIYKGLNFMLTVVVDSFDGYSDLWPCFFSVFQKHWGDCPYEIKLIANHRKFDGIDAINVGDETCWSDRTLKAIERIETKYVLLLLEDYLLGKAVDNRDVNNALTFMEKEHAKYLRLTNIPKSRFNNQDSIFPLYADEEYAINLQASIWEKEFLIDALKKYPGNAWEFEIGFLKSAVTAEHRALEGCYGLAEDPLYIRNGVLKGKWFPKEIRYFTRLGIDIQWQKRGKLSLIQTVKYESAVWLKSKLSYKMRKRIKAFLKKVGFKFASEL